MIATLPVSSMIDDRNYLDIAKVRALEYKKIQPLLSQKKENLFHAAYGITQNGFLDYFESIKKFLNGNDFKIFSFDLGPAAERVEMTSYYYSARSNPLTQDELHKIICARLAHIKQGFRGIIAMENLNYFPTSAYQHVCDPVFISEVIRKTRAHMVLDIGHAIIASQNLAIDIYAYLDSLPLERVVEIHLSAPGAVAGTWRDLHEIPAARELGLLDYVSKRLTVEPYVTVEYYKDFSKLKQFYRDNFRGAACRKR